MILRRFVFSCLRSVAVCLAATGLAQAQQPQLPRFQASVDVTSVDVRVVDRAGRPVMDLQPADFTVRILGKYTRTTDTKLLASAFKSYILGYIRDIPTVTHAEMVAVMEDIATRNPKAKGADARQFYDPAPLDQLAKEGFIKELYPR